MDSVGDKKIQRRAHILAIPLNGTGHINPMLRVTKDLARKGIAVTFVGKESAISGLALEHSGDVEGLDFRFLSLPHSGGPEGKGSVRANIKSLQKAFEPFKEKLLQDKHSGGLVYTAILSDMFLNWSQEAADQLQIPRYMLIPSGVVFARFMQGFPELFSSGQFRLTEDGMLDKFDGSVAIPGLPALSYHELPHAARGSPEDFFVRSERVWQAAGVVVNSFFELEERAIESWRTAKNPKSEQAKVPELYTFGTVPVTPTGDAGLEDSAKQSLLWLDSQPVSSVLYVAFGSGHGLSNEEIYELAIGLEATKQRFLWVILKPRTSLVNDVFPPGFDARIGDRGFILTEWAPQQQILAHPSTGGFLTHSGWNSTVESVMMGVPMIACPRAAEQFLNCRLVVDELKVADELRSGRRRTFEEKEVVRAVHHLMVESEGKAIRSRMKELQKKATGSLLEGGSQTRALEEFTKHLMNQV